jgi:uncharacterized membrane protein YdjX (TVP38/TMEM64 family)
MREKSLVREVLLVLLVVGLCTGLYVLSSELSLEEIQGIIEENRVVGAVLFGVLMFATTVLAPLTSLPLIPLLAPFLGPFTTGIACFTGWSLGAFASFFIGRHYGRPVVSKFIKVETMERYESYIPPETSFFLIVLLRMVLPVDILSYALGMVTTVPFREYALATMLGVSWFSFAFPYLSVSALSGNYVLLGGISVASVVILFVSSKYAKRIIGATRKNTK